MNENINHTNNLIKNLFLKIYLKAHPIKYLLLYTKN